MRAIQVVPQSQRAVSSFVAVQAKPFLDYLHRLPSADCGATFRRWAESKDFRPKDRRALEREVGRRLSLRNKEWAR